MRRLIDTGNYGCLMELSISVVAKLKGLHRCCFCRFVFAQSRK